LLVAFRRKADAGCRRTIEHFHFLIQKVTSVFTGLVEETGRIAQLSFQPPGVRLQIAVDQIALDAKLGDSISVNGCCLTIVEVDQEILTFEAVPETLDRTSLGNKQQGSRVNLERSLKVGDRLGGHFVTGHIDGTARLQRVEEGEQWSKFWFQVDPKLTRQMAEKGSVTVDGVSLTLVDVNQNQFSVALIPHTLQMTTLGELQIADIVNIETDVLAKYVQRQLGSG
jgi:riboflavin synthase